MSCLLLLAHAGARTTYELVSLEPHIRTRARKVTTMDVHMSDHTRVARVVLSQLSPSLLPAPSGTTPKGSQAAKAQVKA